MKPFSLPNSKPHFKSSALLIFALVLIIALRILWMSNFPLMDTTEARYGELARVTAMGHFWLMPHMTPTVPFFAKPPLSTWLAAASWLTLGHNELALRLPSLIMVLLSCLGILYGASSYQLSRQQWLLVCFVMMTAPVGFVSAGAVMTDATQLAVLTWAMVFLWRIFQAESNHQASNTLAFDQIGFWFALGLGAIAKGLATWALIGLPVILFWLFTPKNIVLQQFKKLGSWLGIAIFVSVVLAWYVPAEIYYPGFLKYFIVGEHFQRFLVPGWKGDMYGTAHRQAIGMIWLYWVVSISIWLPIFIVKLYADKPFFNKNMSTEKRWLWAWTLAPLVFFTFSRNIIWTYTLTALPAFAILVATSWPSLSARLKKTMQILIATWLILMWVASFTWLPKMAETHSARKLVTQAQIKYPSLPLYSYGSHEFSVSYYTQGQVIVLENRQMLDKALNMPNRLFILNTQLANQIALSGQGSVLSINASHALLITK